MQKPLPFTEDKPKEDQTQSRLLIMAAAVLIIYAVIRTLAPSIRQQWEPLVYVWDHWLGLAVWGASFSLLHFQSVRKCPARDPYILPVVALLSGIGLMTIWRLYPDLGIRQTIWIALASLLVIAGFHFPNYLDYLRKYKYIWLVSGLILTALTIFWGANPTGSGPKLWLQILGLHIQPSELLKLLVIIYLAGFFADRLRLTQSKIENILPNLFVTGAALILLIFQRDLGTAILFFLIYLAMLFITRGNKFILWLSPILIFSAGILGYFFIDVVRLRFDTWLNPFSDPSGTSYQIVQSMIAIAEGGLIGVGPGMGAPSIVPVSVSDFIYTAVAEELGFLGVTLVILLLIFLIYRGIKLAIATQNAFYRYLILGIIFYLGIQSILIIGGNIGLLPLTGVTLPFVSYGGSSLIISFIAILILLSISHATPEQDNLTFAQRPRYTMISGMIIMILVIEIVATSLISFWFSAALSERADNPRWVIDDRLRPRGEILDRNNETVVSCNKNNGTYQRWSEYIPLSPVVGYTNPIYGQSGIEASMYPYLRGDEGYPYETTFWQDLLYNLPPQGLDVRLTIDLVLQKSLDGLLEKDLTEDISGAAVLMNAHTGEILALSSKPYFDSNELETDWDNLSIDERAPLLNRVTQGMYPPGSTLLPFVATTQVDLIRQNTSLDSLLTRIDNEPQCTLSLDQDLSWEEVFTNGCMGIQQALAESSGFDTIYNLYEDLGFFSEPQMHLPVAGAVLAENVDERDYFLGNGTFTVSPLQMVLAASALSNDGAVPAPRIVNAYRNPAGEWITLPKLSENTQSLPSWSAASLFNAIQETNTSTWEITGSALTVNEDPLTWFMAGTSPDWEGQPTVIVIVLEKDAPIQAQQIGKAILDDALQLVAKDN